MGRSKPIWTMRGGVLRGADLTPTTARLLDAATDLAAVADVDTPHAQGVLGEFLRLYSDWIITHRGMADTLQIWAEQSRILVHCMVGASTLGEAMALHARFASVFWGGQSRTDLRDEGKVTAIVFDEAYEPGVDGLIRAMWPLIATLRQLEFLAGAPLQGVYGRVRNAECLPPGLTSLLFRHSIHYDAAETALIVPTDLMSRAVVARASAVPAFFEHYMHQTVAGKGTAHDMRMRLETLLRMDRLRDVQAPADLPSLAARLGCSAATVRRRLLEQGTTFRAVREETFDALAKTWLQETDWTIEQIAEALGYSDPYGFRRAFRRRNPMSPAAYRQKAVGQHGSRMS